MKRKLMVILLLLAIFFPLLPESSTDTELIYKPDYFEGKYWVIGMDPDTQESYSGTVEMISDNNNVTVERFINGKKVTGKGIIRHIIVGEGEEFVVRFVEGGYEYEAVYLIQPDYDNYLRLTGFINRSDGINRKNGLEALFPKIDRIIEGNRERPRKVP